VEAGEDVVRRAAENILPGAQDVHDAAVRAAPEENRFALRRNDEVLLVANASGG
jgi:hypothetical protein